MHYVIKLRDGTYAKGRNSKTPDLNKARVYTGSGPAHVSMIQRGSYQRPCLGTVVPLIQEISDEALNDESYRRNKP